MKRYTLGTQLTAHRLYWLVPGAPPADLAVAHQDVLGSELVLDVVDDEVDFAMIREAIQAAALAEAWDLAATLVAQYRFKKCCCRCGQFYRGRGVFLAALGLSPSDTARVCQPCGSLLRERQ